MDKNNISRRKFLGIAAAGTAAAALGSMGCGNENNNDKKIAGRGGTSKREIPTDKMTYRTTPSTGDKVSLLGYGFMRLPTVSKKSARENDDEIDQEQVNRLTDFAIEHGVNYFDTSPAYCKGRSEHSMGIALARHPRNKIYIATKLSNFSANTWSREESMKIYKNSLKELQTDYIDYMLLHGTGMSAQDLNGNWISGMEAYKRRYEENGMLDFLDAERKAGRIRNLGFSYHGDIEVFDYLLSMHDKYHWDFVQIQMNYVDWKHAKVVNQRNTDAEYLYAELTKRNIPAVIMEPILGGRLAKLPKFLAQRLQEREPENSIASWSFRFCGTYPNVLTVLSGMTYMEHLQDNLLSYSPLKPCSEEELELLENTARQFVKFPLVPCTRCQYCMPCPYGLDIPKIFSHYNKCINEGNAPLDVKEENYFKMRQAFLIGYDRSVPKLRQASHCIGCGQCKPHCPQNIDIPDRMFYIDKYVEELKQNKFTQKI